MIQRQLIYKKLQGSRVRGVKDSREMKDLYLKAKE
jgi:hypothetical protein